MEWAISQKVGKENRSSRFLSLSPQVHVCIGICLVRDVSQVSIWARFGPMVLGSPGRKLSLVDPAWQRDTSETHEINQTVSEIVSVSSKESNFNQENNSLVLCQSNMLTLNKISIKLNVLLGEQLHYLSGC